MANNYREATQWFFEEMVLQLEQNDSKGGWNECSNRYLIKRLLEEVVELVDAVLDEHNTQEAIVPEAADVANFAMMIADVYQMGIGDK